MRINWFTVVPPQQQPDGSLTAGLASVRYRVLAPIYALDRLGLGWGHKIITVPDGSTPPPDDEALDADLLVFSKSLVPANADLVRRAQARGVPVIFDICDNHYETRGLSEHYREMSGLADQMVCNTREMARVAEPFCTRPPVVIEDPFEGRRGAPAFAPGERLKVLWFGHRLNLDSLQAATGELVSWSRGRPVDVHVLTELNPQLVAACAKATAELGPAFSMSCEAWSQEAQRRALADCDLVVIPSLQTAAKQVKSANRVVETLWAGRPVVAHPVPAYQPFARWTPVTANLTRGLVWLEQNRAAVPGLIAEAQAYIEAHHAPDVLARQWEQVLRTTGALRVAAS